MTVSLCGRPAHAPPDERTEHLVRHLHVLRREVESLRQCVGHDRATGDVMGWATMGLAVLGVLLGLLAVFRN